MKKLIIIALALLPLFVSAQQKAYTPTQENIAAREEFRQERFGIFIHWGVYSMLADGEWVMNNKNISYDEYSKLTAGFCPSAFDAREWVKAIKASGAKYITITSRHHDGFSMFDSDASDYNIVKATPFKRDIIGELAEACREEGIKLHFYYSHLDWGRTDYWPLGNTGHGTGRNFPADVETSGCWKDYQKFMRDQLTELLTKYGPIGAIWFDGVWDKASKYSWDELYEVWDLEAQYDLIHSLQPSCLVGNNHHIKPFPGEDIQIFERDVPGENETGYSRGTEVSTTLPLETCQTMNGSWGYKITDKAYRTPDEFIKYLVRTASKDANLLLNIGPRPDGKLPVEAINILNEMGKWTSVYGETIYGTRGGLIPEQDWGVVTAKGNTMFVHVLNPKNVIFLPYNGNKLVSAVEFGSENKVKFNQTAEGIILTLPESKSTDQIVTLTFKNEI